MAVGIVDRQKLVNIADAVRAKKGITGNMTLDAIASNITSIPTVDNNAKYDFTGSGSKSSGSLVEYLTSIDLTGFDTSNYTSMYSMFSNCEALKNIDVSGFNTSKVTNMGNMFEVCSSLNALDLSNFDFSNINSGQYTGLYGIFNGCKSLKTIKLPATVTFNKSGVCIDNMFSNCSSLTSLDLSGWDTSNVQYMSYMFSNCSSLTTLDLSNFDTSNVTDMNNMLYSCSKLSNLTLGNNWASNSSISSFDLSYSPLTRESAVDVINKLATRSNSPVITFSNKVGLYQSEIDIATNKGWSVSGCSVLIEDPSTATVGQYALIDGVVAKCTYVANEPQAWGQRIFTTLSYFKNSNGVYRFQWGGYGTETGINNDTLGNGLSDTNALIAMNLQSSDGTPTVWDAIAEFRSTHSDRWFIPKNSELDASNYPEFWLSIETSENYAKYRGSTAMYNNNKTSELPINPAIYI